MVRVLHVIDRGADFQTRRCVEHLSGQLGPSFEAEAKSVGQGGNWRGVVAAVRGLRHATDVDVVHAWGIRAMMAAALGHGGRIIFSPDSEMSDRSVRWVRAVMAYRDVHVVCPTATIQRGLVRRGAAPERCELIRPGVDFSRVRRRRDARLRAELGLADEDYVLLAVGESTVNAAHEDAVWAASILHVLDRRYKLLLWGRGPGVSAAERLAAKLGSGDLLHAGQRRLERSVEVEELLPAADMIINTSVGPTAPMPLCIAMAAGLPIVSTVTYTVGELLEDRHTAMLVPKRSPRLMAQRVLELRENAALQWRLSDQARREAYEYFPLTKFLQQWRELYGRLAGRGTT